MENRGALCAHPTSSYRAKERGARRRAREGRAPTERRRHRSAAARYGTPNPVINRHPAKRAREPCKYIYTYTLALLTCKHYFRLVLKSPSKSILNSNKTLSKVFDYFVLIVHPISTKWRSNYPPGFMHLLIFFIINRIRRIFSFQSIFYFIHRNASKSRKFQ